MNCDYNSSIAKFYEPALEEFREKIKDLHPCGVTQETLANEIGLSREHLSRMLSGKVRMDASYFIFLRIRLGLEKDYLTR